MWRCRLLPWLRWLVGSRRTGDSGFLAVTRTSRRLLPLRRFRPKVGWWGVLATLSFGRPRPLLRLGTFGRTGGLLNTRRRRAFRRKVVVVGHA
jgi:hypothetical protein